MATHRALAGRRALRLARRTRPFQESVIREMTRLHAEVGGVNLAQGLPDFDPPKELVAALARAIAVPANHQYGWTWGLPALRAAVSEKTARVNGIRSDPETEVTITCGVSEAVAASVLALTEPGDEAIVLEPWYENYVPACVLAGVKPRFVALSEPDFRLDAKRLARAITPKTRLILVNTPGNPSGRVFTREELLEIARLCQRHGLIAITDEIYERMWFDGHRHVSLGSLPGMEDRTVTLSGLGKTYAVTGLARGLGRRRGAAERAHPQGARLPDDLRPDSLPGGRRSRPSPCRRAYYDDMRRRYAQRREMLLSALSAAGPRRSRRRRARTTSWPTPGSSAGRTTRPSSTFSRGRSASSPCRARASTRAAAERRRRGSTSPRRSRRSRRRRGAGRRGSTARRGPASAQSFDEVELGGHRGAGVHVAPGRRE